MVATVTVEDASNTGDPHTKSLTVPAECTSCVVIIDYYPNLTTPTVTLGGVAPSFSNVYPNNDSTAFYVWDNPPVGAQTLSIDFSPQAPTAGTPAFAFYVEGAKPFDNVSWAQNTYSGTNFAISTTIPSGIAADWLVIRYTGTYNGTPALEDGWTDLGTTAAYQTLTARASYKYATGTSITATGNSTEDYPVQNILAFEPLGGSSFYIQSVTPNNLYSGLTSVTITGVGFGAYQGYSKIFLDGIEQSINAWSNTSIVFDVVNPSTWANTKTLEIRKSYLQAPFAITVPNRTLTIIGKNPMEAYYETTFPNDENPISENGVWFNRTGTFSAMRSVGGNVLITHDGDTNDGKYDDSLAHLEGFPPDHYIEGTIYKTGTFTYNQEIELHVRCQTWANLVNSYEILINPNGGTPQVMRWNGDTDETFYSPVTGHTMYLPGLNNGDVLRAEVIGYIITLYQNGTNRGSADIRNVASGPVFTTGNPGIAGFTRDTSGEQNDRFGFSFIKAGSL